MKRFKSCLLASVGLVILAATVSFTAPGRAFAQRVGEDCVRICDTASNPLHVIVQGITRVTGDVTINNANAIATTVTGPVQVTTSPREPLHVVQRLKLDDRFQKSVSLSMVQGQSSVSTTFAVPAGKLLVIESATGSARTTTGLNAANVQFPLVLVRTTTDGSSFPHPLATTFAANVHNPEAINLYESFGTRWNIGGMIQLYADPGTEVEVIFERPTSPKGKAGTASLDLTLSGHYVDVN
ncbi:MAG: hypothetical protein LC802_18320 [Acidobacteria bacterium]|nr:hypothetical protein [Acidobacteriota bacterium]